MGSRRTLLRFSADRFWDPLNLLFKA